MCRLLKLGSPNIHNSQARTPIAAARVPLVRLAAATLVAAALAPGAPAAAQAAPRRTLPPIETDRPDFVESAVVVPRGYLQMENGLTFQNEGDGSQSLGTETLLRYGAASRLEWRLGIPGFDLPSGTGRSGFGHGDVYAGLKWQLGPIHDVDVAVIPAVLIPLGDPSSTSGAWDPQLAVTVATDLPAGFDLSGMITGLLPTEAGRRNGTVQTLLALGHEFFSPKWRIFVEGFGTYARYGEPGYLAHAGVTWHPSDDMQLDAHAARRIAGDAPESLIAIGFSVRAPLFRAGP